LKNLKK
jgi:dihydrofolate synthase/folylpolyglutamate synthase